MIKMTEIAPTTPPINPLRNGDESSEMKFNKFISIVISILIMKMNAYGK